MSIPCYVGEWDQSKKRGCVTIDGQDFCILIDRETMRPYIYKDGVRFDGHWTYKELGRKKPAIPVGCRRGLLRTPMNSTFVDGPAEAPLISFMRRKILTAILSSTGVFTYFLFTGTSLVSRKFQFWFAKQDYKDIDANVGTDLGMYIPVWIELELTTPTQVKVRVYWEGPYGTQELLLADEGTSVTDPMTDTWTATFTYHPFVQPGSDAFGSDVTCQMGLAACPDWYYGYPTISTLMLYQNAFNVPSLHISGAPTEMDWLNGVWPATHLYRPPSGPQWSEQSTAPMQWEYTYLIDTGQCGSSHSYKGFSVSAMYYLDRFGLTLAMGMRLWYWPTDTTKRTPLRGALQQYCYNQSMPATDYTLYPQAGWPYILTTDSAFDTGTPPTVYNDGNTWCGTTGLQMLRDEIEYAYTIPVPTGYWWSGTRACVCRVKPRDQVTENDFRALYANADGQESTGVGFNWCFILTGKTGQTIRTGELTTNLVYPVP